MEKTIVTTTPNVERDGVEMLESLYKNINAEIQAQLIANGKLTEKKLVEEVNRKLLDKGHDVSDLETTAVILDMMAKGSIQREAGNEPVILLK